MPIEVTPERSWPQIYIQDADLSVRSTNALTRAGLQTLGDVAGRTDLALLQIPDFGRHNLAELRQTIEKLINRA